MRLTGQRGHGGQHCGAAVEPRASCPLPEHGSHRQPPFQRVGAPQQEVTHVLWEGSWQRRAEGGPEHGHGVGRAGHAGTQYGQGTPYDLARRPLGGETGVDDRVRAHGLDLRGGAVALQIAPVRPVQLLRGLLHEVLAADVAVVEVADQLLPAADLLAARVAVAQERVVVDDGVGQPALGAQFVEVEGLAGGEETLADAESLGPHQGEVEVEGLGESQGGVHDGLGGHVREPLGAADDMADPHQAVVDHDGEVVGGPAVGAADDVVAEPLGVDADVAADQVVRDDHALVGYAQPHRGGAAGRLGGASLGGRQVTAAAVVGAGAAVA